MRTIRSTVFLFVIGLLVLACSGSAASSYLDTTGEALPAAGSVQDSDTMQGGASNAPEAASPPQPYGPGQVAAVDDAKIIRTGTMSLEVTDVPTARRSARDAIVGLGGYVGASTTSNKDDRPTAEITYRIPVARWEQALDALRSLNGLTMKVVAEHTDAIEVTSQIVDLDARIANLRASETALQAIAAQATKISDILDVQARLTETRGQIESLAAQHKDLSDRAAYSSLTVLYNVPIVAVEVATSGWDPAGVIDSASATTVSLLQDLATAGIWFAIVWLPIIAVLLIVGLVVVFVARRLGLGRRIAGGPPPSLPMAGEG
jgi:Domain of unknown function (DUF4349)